MTSSDPAIESSSPADNSDPDDAARLGATAFCLRRTLFSYLPQWLRLPPPHTAANTQSSPSLPTSTDPDSQEKTKTVYYLAYGSNLCAKTFRGKRGIRPISEVNVCVPSLKLTFDLPGIPYMEPCFANTARRDVDAEYDFISIPTSDSNEVSNPSLNEKTPLLTNTSSALPIANTERDYHKDHWSKPLVGVLYELTPADFAHVIATEGGGASYKDILVPCFELPAGSTDVPMNPDTTPIVGHTLFAPAGRHDNDPETSRTKRPDPSYAQASSRYLKLITDGATEHSLPQEYQDYLAQIRPYKATTRKQKFGAVVFAAVWIPVVMIMFAIQRMVVDKNGKVPKWMARLSTSLFSVMWSSYENIFYKLYGDGERTIGE